MLGAPAALRPLKGTCYSSNRTPTRPQVLRRVQCQAKTTSSRKTSSSKSSDSSTAASSTDNAATSGGVQQPITTSTRKPTAPEAKSVQERFEAFVSFLTPKQEGDAGDLFMICLSMAVLVYMSMQLYRLYAYAYFTMDHYQTVVDLMS